LKQLLRSGEVTLEQNFFAIPVQDEESGRPANRAECVLKVLVKSEVFQECQHSRHLSIKKAQN